MINAIRIKITENTATRITSIYNGITHHIKINYFLIFLFAYTAISKLNLFSYNPQFKFIDLSNFEEAMFKSPVLRPYVHELAWMIPVSEIAVCMLLLFNKTKKWGYYCSLLLLSAFTAYIIYILNAYTHHLPCVCGGVITLMSWSQHLVFNFFFVLITVRAIYLMHRSPAK